MVPHIVMSKRDTVKIRMFANDFIRQYHMYNKS